MSSGSYSIFLTRPIALVLFMAALALLLLNVVPVLLKKADWRRKVGFAAGQEEHS